MISDNPSDTPEQTGPRDATGCPPDELVIAPHPSGESYPLSADAPGVMERSVYQKLLLASLEAAAETQPQRDERQYTLTSLLVLMFSAAVALALVRSVASELSPRSLATAAGGLASLGLLLFAFVRPWFLVRAIWWGLVGIWGIAAAVAIFRG